MKLPLDWLRDFVDVAGRPGRRSRAAWRRAGSTSKSVEGDVIDFEITANRPDCLSVVRPRA